MKLNRMARMQELLVLVGCLLLVQQAWSQRDTVSIQGQVFVLVTESVADADDLQQQVHLLRMQGSKTKWLMRHTLLAESADCNSFAIEVGGYAVSDTGIVFYTAWMHTDKALAGLCGVRKQAYRINEKGGLVQGERICWVNVGPANACLYGLESEQSEMLQAQPPASARIDRQAFLRCLETELSARVVTGAAQSMLLREVQRILAPQLREAMQHAPDDFEWVKCD